ncbi:hypothetical protein [Saccharothrix sp. NRRL B-16314]|uniref:hypothetical protein n=1 Tax=Saccharothrix sp. NRRL B-16314 TaxID=1463825 RepID=UPI000AF1D635|nr:hypothetical protein [Saccharothrix sp. NRRL B-16314]
MNTELVSRTGMVPEQSTPHSPTPHGPIPQGSVSHSPAPPSPVLQSPAPQSTAPESAAHSAGPADVLEAAVERVLVAVRPSNLADPLSGARHAEESLRAVLRRTDAGSDDAFTQAVACAEAACEHLRYCELQEARLLLVAARGQLARSHDGRT